MPSSAQAIPVYVVFDYLKDAQNNALANARVSITLNTDQATSITPQVVLQAVEVVVTTDANGYWQASLVSNTNISPANTLYNVRTPVYTYQITVGTAGPYQSTAVGTIVNVPSALTPASGNITGPLTIAGALNGATATFTGALAALSGAFTNAVTAASATLTGALTAASATLSGAFTALTAVFATKPWADVTHPNYGADPTGVADSSPAFAAAIAALPAGGGILWIPAGTYKLLTPIAPGAKHIHMMGAGRDLDNSSNPPTTLSYQPVATGTAAMTISSHSTILEGLILLQGNATAATKGIQMSGVFSTTLRDLTVRNFTAAGITYQALTAASCIWNNCYNVEVANCTVGLDLIGFVATSRVINNNVFVGCQFTGNALSAPNVRLTAGTSENSFLGCDVTGGNGQTLVQIGDSVNTCRGNIFWGCTAEGGGAGGIGFQLTANSSMTWISAEITSTTHVQQNSGATGFLWDHVNNTWNTFGAIGVTMDSAGNLGAATATLSGNITMTAASSAVFPGATSLTFWNHAASLANLILSDAGAATLRAGLAINGSGVQVGAGALAYAQVVATQGTFTAQTDLTSLTVTVTVQTGRRIRITACAGASSSVGGDVVALQIQEGATVLQIAQFPVPVTAFAFMPGTSQVILSPTAAAHTYKLTMGRVNGTGNITMQAGATFPAFILVEDIGV